MNEIADREAATGPCVLIVDDSRMVRASIIKHIQDHFEIREEGDGEAGWQTLMSDPAVQILISDLTMPQLDGYGLLERVRSSEIERIRQMPVVMISGDEDESARSRAKELGATDFITKGIGTSELLARLNALVRLIHMQQALERASQQPLVDPQSGLHTAEYLRQQGGQTLALAQRHGGEISVVAIVIEGFEALVAKLGRAVMDQLMTQLRAVLSRRIRLEDTVSQTGPARFTILCPGIGLEHARAFAGRIDQTIRKATIRYRDETVTVALGFGFSHNREDACQDMAELLQLAEDRAEHEAGQGQASHAPTDSQELAEVLAAESGSGGEPSGEAPPSVTAGLEEALVRLARGETDALRAQAPQLLARLLPLLALLDESLELGLDLDALGQRAGSGFS